MKSDNDVELVALQHLSPLGRPAPEVPQHRLNRAAEQVLSDFYERQRARHARDRERLLRSRSASSTSRPQQNGFSAKWNRQALYLEESTRSWALNASRRHLVRHPEWWEGPTRLSASQLCEIVAAQHFFEVDFEDLLLPEGQRRSEDTFSSTGNSAGADICDQFLLDAPRSCFIIEGETFDLGVEATLKTMANLDQAQSAREAARTQQAFTERLLGALQRCLSVHPSKGKAASLSPLLLRAVTTAMSQSGMASLERATAQPQVVASGGEQQLRYELRALGAGDSFTFRRGSEATEDGGTLKEPLFAASTAGGPLQVWELQLLVRKSDFHSCMVFACSPDDETMEDPLPLACSMGSIVEKACKLHIWLSSDRAHVDLVDLGREIKILDEDGQPHVLPQPLARSDTDQKMRMQGRVVLLVTACGRAVGGRCCKLFACVLHILREVSVRVQRRLRPVFFARNAN